MTQSGYSSALVNVMLGWLKALANWVLKLFNLSGGGLSPLMWLSKHWMQLLVFCLAAGVAMDFIVWMLRWRPYWVWFRRQRIVVNDERMLSERSYEKRDARGDYEKRYVVPSTIVKRRPAPAHRPKPAARPQTATSRQRPGTVTPGAHSRPTAKTSVTRRPQPRMDVFTDEMFEVGQTQNGFQDVYEDEVFDVSNLPKPVQPTRKRNTRRR